MIKTVALADLIRPAKVRRAGEETYPLLSMTMHNGLVDQTAKFKKRVASSDVSDYKVIKEGQLVVGFPIDEGVLDFLTAYNEGIVSPAYGVWDLAADAPVHRPYLKKFLRSGPALAYYKGKLRGSTARRRSLPTEVFLALRVPLPPLPEQRRIAAILDDSSSLRAKYRQTVPRLEALAQAIYDGAVRDAPTRTIREMLENGMLLVHKDGNHGSLYPRADDFDHVGVPFLTAKAVKDDGSLDLSQVDRLNETKAVKLKIGWIQRDDVLLSHNASVGKVTTYMGELGSALIGTSLTCFRPDGSRLLGRFLSASLRSARFQRQLRHDMAQTTRNQVPITAQRELSVPLIEPSAQQEITSKLNAVEVVAGAARRAIVRSDELQASLESRAFRGEL